MLIDFKGSLNMSSSDFGPITNTSSLPRPTMSVKYFNSSSIFTRCFSNPCASLYPSREMTVFWCNPNPKYRQSPTGTQSIWDLLFSQKEDNLSLTSISLSSGTQNNYEYIRTGILFSQKNVHNIIEHEQDDKKYFALLASEIIFSDKPQIIVYSAKDHFFKQQTSIMLIKVGFGTERKEQKYVGS